MANTVDNIVLQNDGQYYAHRYLVWSDGTTAMSDAIVVDKSTLTCAETGIEPVALDLVELEGFAGGTINFAGLEWDHTTDDEIISIATGAPTYWRREWGRLKDPRSAGATGDVMVTTNGLSTGAWFQFYAVWELRAR